MSEQIPEDSPNLYLETDILVDWRGDVYEALTDEDTDCFWCETHQRWDY